MEKMIMKMEKFVYYFRKIVSYVGAISLGCYIAVIIENQVFDWVIGCGLIASLLLMICANLDNKLPQEDIWEDCIS
jgi:hypothetical protein